MAKIEVIVGTTLGSAEYVADEMMAQLTDQGHQVQVHLTPTLCEIDTHALWIIVSSTHGAGDLPDNIQPFFNEITEQKPDLSQVNFALCAIGDSSYDTFCQGPEKLISAIQDCDAKAFVDKIQIDVQLDPVPEDPALAWLAQWQQEI
ncbi:MULTISPECIES: FMN-binding protein MioC [Shewanella]|jgi:MioC protein|uniref:Flavodoxin/nitric oxide synthase n=1 Tax=Shewanella baltica (strain OS195) TaxID=399599 RepID=A9KX18_SHEB9|nr:MULTISPECIES: FMN-binding protein MioC [Shewanella]ABS10491.1 flavodoxin/nitric oxide synthase [Shewanella baltica OS185]ABX51676.1 flavodoxin/nitric oxide synthase [Shewanella baltica OS195]ADT96672.1 flavodoxin/nitric oxide synthase [Shewanella baltica OS678]AEG13524.1 flavodoxin/nitric oxide synthase [Shewanella baltica BA175]AVT47679.1 FMN-binding protein MioC [Shewanella baltica]